MIEHVMTWAGTAEAELYEQGRPDYPPALTALLAEQLNLGAGRRVLDVAAGTGKLTRRLLSTGVDVFCAEPMPGMRVELHRLVPAAHSVASCAETLPVRDGAMTAVTVAQAFHWFDVARATEEFRRVLGPGGRLAVINNRRDDRVSWIAEITEILMRYERLAPRPASARRWREELEASEEFTDWQEFELPHAQKFTSLADFDARFLSVSSILLLDTDQQTALLGELHAVVADVEPLVMPLRTTVRIATRRS